jgi:hypothetical protein
VTRTSADAQWGGQCCGADRPSARAGNAEGLIACHYRVAESRHKEIGRAAHELLQYLDRKTA